MSFLLDALRKSENQKHLGDVPSIHSSSGLEPRSRSPVKLGLLLVILLPAFLVLAWYAWQSTQEPVGSEPSQMGGDVNTREPQPVLETRTEPASQENMPPVNPPGVSTPARPDGPRTAVEAYVAPQSNSSTDPGDEPGMLIDASGGEASSVVVQAPRRAETPVESTADLINPSPADRAGVSTGANRPVQRAQNYRQPQLEAISYWNLPQSIREEIPQPKISVLVYAEGPGDRFIIMNGRRLAEGDEVQTGLELLEIRRDGAVFTYRLYKFLVSR